MVANFFALRRAVGTQFLDEQSATGHLQSRLLISNHVTARMPDQPGFTDRQEIDRSIAPYCSRLCALQPSQSLKSVFD
jgi:hypothetical protein